MQPVVSAVWTSTPRHQEEHLQGRHSLICRVTYRVHSPHGHALKYLAPGIPIFPHLHHAPHPPSCIGFGLERSVRSLRPGWSSSYLISLLRPIPTLIWCGEEREGNINRQASESPLFKTCCKHLEVDWVMSVDNMQCLGPMSPKQEDGTWQRDGPPGGIGMTVPLARGYWEEPGGLAGQESQVCGWMAEGELWGGDRNKDKKEKSGTEALGKVGRHGEAVLNSDKSRGMKLGPICQRPRELKRA